MLQPFSDERKSAICCIRKILSCLSQGKFLQNVFLSKNSLNEFWNEFQTKCTRNRPTTPLISQKPLKFLKNLKFFPSFLKKENEKLISQRYRFHSLSNYPFQIIIQLIKGKLNENYKEKLHKNVAKKYLRNLVITYSFTTKKGSSNDMTLAIKIDKIFFFSSVVFLFPNLFYNFLTFSMGICFGVDWKFGSH